MPIPENITFVKKIGNFISNILLGETKEVIVRTDEKVQGLVNITGELKETIENIRLSLTNHGLDIQGLKVHTKYGVSNSPTVPNEVGKKLLEDSGFTKIYPNLQKEIFAIMDSKNLRTLYDYEKGAMEVLKTLKDSPNMDSLKDYSVNNPGESLDLIFQVASWLIRDDYAKYKGKQTNASITDS